MANNPSEEVRRRAGRKFLVLLGLLAVFLAWRARPDVRVGPRSTTSLVEENRSSAFVIQRGTRAALRRDAQVAAAAEAAVSRAAARVVPGLGEGGVAVTLEGEEGELAERIRATEAFNLLLSDKISLERSIPDHRHPLCRRDWTAEGGLPGASVVVVFHNEPLSTLLRTVHSVLRHSPAHLLHEVILVDDRSDREELQDVLGYYLDSRFAGRVRLVRLPRRWGLIRAKLVGAYAAKAKVLVFLDAHCEVTEQWLEPLLQHVRDDRRAVAVPMIDWIDAETLEYKPRDVEHFKVGGFTWAGDFCWVTVPPAEQRRRGTAANHTRTPVMAGGLFAMDREYFWEVGSYDERMDIWGGENLEMSFRVWTCGGSISVVPCSRVGHVFRPFSPYPHFRDWHGINTARLAHVWMDEYKRLFFLHRPDLRDARTGDLTSREELRRRLQCRSFRWYLENVYPQKIVVDENVQAYGRVRPRAVAPDLCLQQLPRSLYERGLIITSCIYDNWTASQVFALTSRGELRWDNDCAEVTLNDTNKVTRVTLRECSPLESETHREWEYTEGSQIRHKLSGLCMDAKNLTNSAEISMDVCSGIPSQIWTFENFYNLDRNRVKRPMGTQNN